ncbi:cytochrome P450 alkane hydroxylase [Nemania abortiva]|nr:cytochrome P450 alkane hydroxylase [Nemania abortiva]
MHSFYLLVLLLGLYLIHHYHKRRREQKELDAIALENGCLPAPTVQNHRPLGIDRLEQIFRADTEARLMELFLFHFQRHGYTMKQVLFMSPAFGTADPVNLEAIASTNSSDWSFSPRREIALPILGDGILTQEGHAWKRSREILRPQFPHRFYEDLQVFRGPVEDLLKILPKPGGVVDLQPLFFQLTLDVSTAFLFGKSVRSLLDPQNSQEQTFSQAFDTCQSYVVSRLRFVQLYWLIGGKRLRDACAKVQTFADQIIDQNLSNGETAEGQNDGRYVFLKALAKAYPDRATLRGQIISLLVGGRDTTACTLSWVFFLLVRHPRVMEKLRSEISALDVKEEDLRRVDLRNLNYLHKVLKETLRLYPPVPIDTRTSTKTTILPTGGGPDGKSPVLVPKGTAIGYSMYTIHRRPDLYGMDAEIFRPERWDEDLPLFRDRTTQNYGYLPFGIAPRTCLGKDFALTEAAYIITRIFKRYPKIALPEGERVELLGVEKQNTTLVLQIAEGCKVELG